MRIDWSDEENEFYFWALLFVAQHLLFYAKEQQAWLISRKYRFHEASTRHVRENVRDFNWQLIKIELKP